MIESNWKFLSITPKLFKMLLHQLVNNHYDKSFEVYIDPELKRYQIITTQEFINHLKEYLPSIYFRKENINLKTGMYSTNLNLEQFLNYRKGVNSKIIKINSYVRFTADGQIYIVESIDEQKNKCLISKKGANQKISLRVPITMVEPTLRKEN